MSLLLTTPPHLHSFLYQYLFIVTLPTPLFLSLSLLTVIGNPTGTLTLYSYPCPYLLSSVILPSPLPSPLFLSLPLSTVTRNPTHTLTLTPILILTHWHPYSYPHPYLSPYSYPYRYPPVTQPSALLLLLPFRLVCCMCSNDNPIS